MAHIISADSAYKQGKAMAEEGDFLDADEAMMMLGLGGLIYSLEQEQEFMRGFYNYERD